jgi:hypothetical protein
MTTNIFPRLYDPLFNRLLYDHGDSFSVHISIKDSNYVGMDLHDTLEDNARQFYYSFGSDMEDASGSDMEDASDSDMENDDD